MQVWDGVTGARISFDWTPTTSAAFQPVKSTTIATMAENTNLISALLARLTALGGVDIFSPTKVQSIELGTVSPHLDLSSWPILTLSDGQTLAARLLVGADGANSPVRRFAGIQSRGFDYGRQGVVATLQLSGAGWGGLEHKTAYQRFLPTGPIAMLPLPGKMATLVWSTTPDRAAKLKAMSPTNFIAMVNAGFRLSPVDLQYLHDLDSGHAEEVAWRQKHTPTNARELPVDVVQVQDKSAASFPLRMQHADTYTGERVALVG